MANPVTWFEIPVDDMTRARRFYEHVLRVELEVQDFGNLLMAWFPAEHGAPGATGSLVKGDSYIPSHSGSMVYFSVDDIDATLARVGEAGGRTVSARMGIGEYGFVGHFEDTEGNRVALHSMT